MRDRFLSRLADTVLTHPRAALAVVLTLLLASLFVVPTLRVHAGHSSLVSEDDVHQRRFEDFLERFGSPNVLMAVVGGGNERLRRQLVDRLATRLPRAATDAPRRGCAATDGPNSPGCVRDVFGRVELDQVKSMALLYLPVESVEPVVEALSNSGEGLGLQALIELSGLRALFALMSAEIERRATEPPPEGARARKVARLAMDTVARFLDEVRLRVEQPARAKIPLEEALFEQGVRSGIDARGYLSSRDGAIKLAMVRPVNDSDEPSVVVPFVRYVQRHGAAATAELGRACAAGGGACPDGELRLRLTGLPAIIADETDLVNRDVLLTSLVAIAGIVALFVFGFRSVRQIVLGVSPLLVGLLWTLAFARLAFGHLNLVTAAFIATLLGLGIDFAVHLLSRFNELRGLGRAVPEATRAAILGAGPGILTGALTTAGAFVALAVNDFQAFSQLGVITGVGLLFVLGTTLVMMPAMLVLPKLRRFQGRPVAREPRVDVARVVTRAPLAFVLGALLIAGAMLLRAQEIPWSYDYMELMPRGLASVQAMATVSERTDYSANVAAIEVDSAARARATAAALRAKPSIRRVESIAGYIPTQQQRKLKLLARLEPILARASRPTAEPVDVARIRSAVQDLVDSFEDARFEAKRGGADQGELLVKPTRAARRLLATLERVPERGARPRLEQLQRALLADVARGVQVVRDNVAAEPVTVSSLLSRLPAGLADRLHSARRGTFAVYAYPARPIWDKENLRTFVAELRAVSPEVTGFPVTHWETSQAIERGFRRASVVAAVALVLLLLVDFRSPRYTLLALAPLAMGIAWMWGGISLLGIEYNFVNIIAFPLIIGIGVASGVHILHRYRQEGERDVAPVVRHTGMAVFLSAATTMVGFGSLSLARHQGAASLGTVLLLGVGSCLLTATLFLPALLQLLQRLRRRPAGPDDGSE